MSVAHDPHQNHLLAALPEMDFDRMSASLKLVPLRLGQVLYESGSQQRSVYFPTTAIVSLLYMLANGAAAEIAVVGNEGIIGVSLFMGGETTPSRAVVQSAGHAYQWTGRLLKEEFTRGGAMQHLLLRYTQALLKAQHRIVSVANDERSPPFSMHDAETLIAALHRDWGEAQGNYDEFRFFTRLRPSEQIALVLSDLDLVNGIISINKARVSGVDRHMTKTGDDRRVQLCPRALLVLKRQLRLRARLDASGKAVRRAHQDAAPSASSMAQDTAVVEAALSATVYRTPFFSELEPDDRQECSLGRQAAWPQHCDDARAYAAWAEGSVETDIETIKNSMNLTPVNGESPAHEKSHASSQRGSSEWRLLALDNLAVDLPVAQITQSASALDFAVTCASIQQ